jgi:hypothetical protein
MRKTPLRGEAALQLKGAIRPSSRLLKAGLPPRLSLNAIDNVQGRTAKVSMTI